MQIGIYMLFVLGETHDINNAGLYRDDDLSVFKIIDRPEACKKSKGHNKEYQSKRMCKCIRIEKCPINGKC